MDIAVGMYVGWNREPEKMMNREATTRRVSKRALTPDLRLRKENSPEGPLRLYEEEHGQFSRRDWWRTKSKGRVKGGIAYV